MPKHMKQYKRKHLRENKEKKPAPAADYRYPIEKPIIDIYREIGFDLWDETTDDDFLSDRPSFL